jgi:hypothetical protein
MVTTRDRVGLAGVLAMVLVLLGPVAPALAAAPANDAYWNAKPMTPLPYVADVDTTQATVTSGDPDCASSSNTVWYRFTPAVSGVYTFSAYDFYNAPIPSVGLFSGSRLSATLLACGVGWTDQDGVQFAVVRGDLEAGRTYHVGVGTYNGLSEPVGGAADITVQARVYEEPHAYPALVSTRLDRRTGLVTITGTVDCTGTYAGILGASGIDVTLRQVRSGFVARSSWSYGWEFCVGTEAWSTTLESETARAFGTGWATLTLTGGECDFFTCNHDPVQLRVRLSSK